MGDKQPDAIGSIEEIPRRSLLTAGVAGMAGALAGCSGVDSGGEGNGSGDGGENVQVQQDEVEQDLPGPEDGTEYQTIDPIHWLGMTRQFSIEWFETQKIAVEHIKRLGVDINLEPMDFGRSGELSEKRQHEMRTSAFLARPERLDPIHMFDSWVGASACGGYNTSEYINPAYDKAWDKFMNNLEMEKRIEGAHELQNIQSEDQPALYMHHSDSLSAYNTNHFSNWQNQIGGAPFWNVWNLTGLEPVDGRSTCVYGTGREPATLNFYDQKDAASAETQKIYYDSLFRIGLNGEPTPWLAEGSEIVDETTVDVSLRDDFTFHDGEPVTAEDVAFTYNSIINRWQIPRLSAHYRDISGVEVLDDTAVRFNLKAPFGPLHTNSFTQVLIMPKHIWDGVTEREGVDHPNQWGNFDRTGSGIFKLVEYEPSSRIAYEVHEDHPYAPNFDTLVWNIYGSDATAVGDLESDKVSFVQALAPTLYDQLEGVSQVERLSGATHNVAIYYFNHTVPPLNDKPLRRAFAWSINRQQIIDTVLNGRATPAASSVAPANETFHNPDTPLVNNDMDKAIGELTDAGYRWDEDGNLLIPKSRMDDLKSQVHDWQTCEPSELM